jgi:hypothetical protein
VDEVVGDLDIPSGAREAAGVGDVADVEVETPRLQRVGPGGVADQAADGGVLAPQRRSQPTADEPRGTGDESAYRDPPKLPGPLPGDSIPGFRTKNWL